MWQVHNDTGGTAALKVLLEPESPYARAMSEKRRREDQTRLRREGQALADLAHPNIVRLIEVIDDEVLAVVTELVQGPNLAEWMARGPWPPSVLSAVFDGILDGVQAAHAAGWIHRDLKPGNVLIALEVPPIAKVADFGLAHISTATRLTRSGTVMGTPSYMAPEQINAPSSVEPTADIFALGAILYELWCDRPPFQGADATATLHQASAGLYADPAALRPDLPTAVAAAIAGALDPEPATRIPDCHTFRQVLRGERSWARSKTAIVPDTLVIPVQRTRRWWPWIGGLACGIAVLGGLAAAWWSAPSIPSDPSPHVSDSLEVQAHFDDAWTLWRNAELNAASDALEPVLRAEPGQGWVSLLDAMILGAQHHESESLAALSRATPPNDAPGQDLLIALRADPRGTEPERWSTLADAHPHTTAVQAVACIQLESSAAATRVCRRASANGDFALLHYFRARTSLVARDLETADEHLTTLLTAHPDHTLGRTLRAAWLQASGETDAAVAEAERVFTASPDHPEALLGRARARANAGDREGARADFDRARNTRTGPAHTLASADEAWTWVGLGETTRPRQVLQDASDKAQAEGRWADVMAAQTELGWIGWYLRDADLLRQTRQSLMRAAAELEPDAPYAQGAQAHQEYLSALEAIIRGDSAATSAARKRLQALRVPTFASLDRAAAVEVLLAYELALNGNEENLVRVASRWPSCEAKADGGLILQSYRQHDAAVERFQAALVGCTHSGQDRFFRFIAAQGLANDASRRGDIEAEGTFRREMRRTWPSPDPEHPRANQATGRTP